MFRRLNEEVNGTDETSETEIEYVRVIAEVYRATTKIVKVPISEVLEPYN